MLNIIKEYAQFRDCQLNVGSPGYAVASYSFIFILGIIVGSFLNVCILSLPKGNDIVQKASCCPGCGSHLRWHELLPLVSFIWLRGRCRHCMMRLTWQYPLVEAANGLIWMGFFVLYGMSMTTLLYAVCASVLIIVAVVDYRTYEIPPGLNICIGILGLFNLLLNWEAWPGYVAGFFAVSTLFLVIHLLSHGRSIGGGDIKLMAAAGLLLGWQGIILALMVAATLASIIHICLMLCKGKGRVLPFGPYLAAGIFVAMTAGEPIINWYMALSD